MQLYNNAQYWTFWNFWGPMIFFTTLTALAVLFGVLAVRSRETGAATLFESVGRSVWVMATIVWCGWTIPTAQAAFDYAMNFGLIRGIFDPTELIIRTFTISASADGSLDWYLFICTVLLAVTVLDVAVFDRLHRSDVKRYFARCLSGTITVLIMLPVWLMNLIVLVPLVRVWKAHLAL